MNESEEEVRKKYPLDGGVVDHRLLPFECSEAITLSYFTHTQTLSDWQSAVLWFFHWRQNHPFIVSWSIVVLDSILRIRAFPRSMNLLPLEYVRHSDRFILEHFDNHLAIVDRVMEDIKAFGQIHFGTIGC